MSHHRLWVISTAAVLIERLSFLNCLFYVMPKIHPGRDHGQRGQCQCVFAGVHVHDIVFTRLQEQFHVTTLSHG